MALWSTSSDIEFTSNTFWTKPLLHRARILTHRCSDWSFFCSALQVPATSSAPCHPQLRVHLPVPSVDRLDPAPTAWPSGLRQPGRYERPHSHECNAACAGTPGGSENHKALIAGVFDSWVTDTHTHTDKRTDNNVFEPTRAEATCLAMVKILISVMSHEDSIPVWFFSEDKEMEHVIRLFLVL